MLLHDCAFIFLRKYILRISSFISLYFFLNAIITKLGSWELKKKSSLVVLGSEVLGRRRTTSANVGASALSIAERTATNGRLFHAQTANIQGANPPTYQPEGSG